MMPIVTEEVEVIHPRVCGLDLHKRSVVATLRVVDEATGKVRRETRTFTAFTQDLRRLREWMESESCTHVAMESTGSFWKPVVNILEEGAYRLVLVNTRDVRMPPGHKTDRKDAERIAQLLQYGLLKESFVASREQREQRELSRLITSSSQDHTRLANRLQKILEGGNIKLASVASNVLGVSGVAMLRALAEGENDPHTLAQLAKGSLRTKLEELEQALEGKVSGHQRVLIRELLEDLAYVEQRIQSRTAELTQRQGPHTELLLRMQTLSGVGPRLAQVVLAEVGPTVETFPTAAHLCSWAGLAPGMNESAGVNRSGKTTRGNKALRTALVEAAWAARKTRTTIGRLFWRLCGRIGPKKAAVAVARRILEVLYHIIKDGTVCNDALVIEPNPKRREGKIERLLKELAALGYTPTNDAVRQQRASASPSASARPPTPLPI